MLETSWRWTDFGSHKLADYITVKTALQYELLQALNQVKNQFGAPDTITVYTKHTYILNCLRKTGKLSELEVYILTTLEDINAQVEIKPAQNCDCMKQLKKLAEQEARTTLRRRETLTSRSITTSMTKSRKKVGQIGDCSENGIARPRINAGVGNKNLE